MLYNFFKIFTIACICTSALITNITATEDPEVARGERRFAPHQAPYQHPAQAHPYQYPAQAHPYHPAAREDTLQDINRAGERNALENEGIYGGAVAPVYPIDSTTPNNLPPSNPPPSSGSVNINISPQTGGSIPQH